MKSVKTLALTALVAVAALAIVGASPAMATSTQVCATHSEPCGTAVASSTFHLASGTIWLFQYRGGEMPDTLCLSVLLTVDYGSLGSPQEVEILAFTLGSCGTEGSGGSHSNCQIEALHLPWSATLLKTTLNEGTFEITDTEAGLFVKCTVFGFVKIECEYNLEQTTYGTHGTAGGNNGLLWEEGILPKIKAGSLCPEEVEITSGTLEPLSASYIVG